MNDSLSKTESFHSFRTSLIASEIIVTAIVMVGFYLIFNHFNKKNKAFKKGLK